MGEHADPFLQGRTLLLIDDSPLNLRVLVTSLENWGAELLVAQDGDEGLRRAEITRPDLILLDVMMPGIDGIEVCRRLKANPVTREIPVIFLTSLSSIRDKVAGFEAGGIDYLTKPLHVEEVRARVGTHLRARVLQRQLEENNAALAREVAERRRAEEKLRQRELEFRTLAQSLPASVIRLDRGCRCRYANPEFEATFGVSAADLIGREIAGTLPQQFRSIAQAVARVAAGGAPELMEVELPDRGAGARHLLLRMTPELDDRQAVAGVLAVGTDISELKRLEQELRAQSELRQTLLDAIRDVGMQVLIIEGERVVHVGHRAIAEQFGYTQTQIDAHPSLADFIHPDDREWVMKLHRRRLTGDVAPGSYELRLVTQGGDARDYEVSVVMVPGSRPPRLVAVGRDISERKRVERELFRREQEFRAIVEHSPDTVARYDRQMRCSYANPSLIRLLGHGAEAIMRTPSELLPASTSVRGYERAIEESLETGRENDYTLHWQASDGESLWSHIRIVPELGRGGEVASVLAVGRDITDLVDAKRRLEESQEQLRRLLTHREESYEARQKWAAWEVYDSIGQLLMAMRIDIELLRRGAVQEGEKCEAHLARMTATTDRAIQVVRTVADELRPSPLNMGVAFGLEWMVTQFRNSSGLRCRLRIEEEQMELDDQVTNLLFRVVREALDNVARHSEATQVTIELRPVPSGYLLKVRDDGKGFDPSLQFEGKFGLLYMQERIYSIGGEVVFLSELGQGTVIEARLPAPRG